MAKAVLTTNVNPTYEDLPEVRYHFPRTYLAQVTAAVGDWVVYYEPRRTSGDLPSRGGRQCGRSTPVTVVVRLVGVSISKLFGTEAEVPQLELGLLDE